MADETLNIVVDDSGSTTTVTNNLIRMAQAADTVADSTDKVTQSTKTAADALNTEAAAAAKVTDAQTKAATAVKGYVDAQGNYIRQVGSNKDITAAAASAQDTLTKTISASSIEAGRAAAGYGALNSATASSANSNAAFNNSVRALNTELGTYGSASNSAAAATANVGSASNNAAGAHNALAGAMNAGAGAANGAADAHNNAGRAANNNGAQANTARARYGAFNETVADTIRRLGLLAVAFVGVRAADFVTELDNAKARLNTFTGDVAITESAMAKLGVIQKTLGVDITSLTAAYTKGAGAFRALGQDAGLVPGMIQQITNAARVSGSSVTEYSAAAGKLFDTFKGGIATTQTLQMLQQSYPGLLNLITQGFAKTSMGAGDAATASDRLRAAFANGQISAGQFAVIMNNMVPAINQAAGALGTTLPTAVAVLYQSLVNYIQTNETAKAATYALSGALLSLAQAPGAVIAAMGALAAAIVAIGLASFVSAVTTLGTAFMAIAAPIAGFVAGIAGVSAGVVAAGAAILAFTAYIATHVGSINNMANSWGGYNTVIGTVLKQIALLGQMYSLLGQAIVAGVQIVAGWIAKAYDWAMSFAPVNAAITKIIEGYNYLKETVKTVYGYVTGAADEYLNSVSKAQESSTSWFDDLAKKGAEAAKSFDNISSSSQTYTTSLNTASRSMAQITQLTKDGSAANISYVDSANKASSSITGVGSALGSTSTALGSYTTAVGDATAGTGTFDSALSHLQQQLKATQANIGEFTQAQIDSDEKLSNVRNSQGQHTWGYGPAGTYNNSISGRGGSSSGVNQTGGFFGVSGSNLFGPGGDPFFNVSGSNLMGGGDPFFDVSSGMQFAGGGSFIVPGAGGTDSTPVNFMATPGEQVVVLTPDQQQAAQASPGPGAFSPVYGDAGVSAAMPFAGGAGVAQTAPGTLAAGTTPDAYGAGAGVAGASYPGTASLSAPVAANTNTQATNLPDLLLQAGGSFGVGDSITQTSVDWGNPQPTETPQTTVGPNTWEGIAAALNGVGVGGGGGAAPRTPVVNIQIKADDYGQFKQSQRQIAMDIGQRVANAGSV